MYQYNDTYEMVVSAIFLNVKQYKNEARITAFYTFRDGYVMCKNGYCMDAPKPGTKEAMKYWKGVIRDYLKSYEQCADLTEMLSVSYFSSEEDFYRTAKGSSMANNDDEDDPTYVYYYC